MIQVFSDFVMADILGATAPPSPGGDELMVDPNEVFPAIGSVAMGREDTHSLARDAGVEEEEMGPEINLIKSRTSWSGQKPTRCNHEEMWY